MPPIPIGRSNFSLARGFHPLAPGPNANEIMGIIEKHFLNCQVISGNAQAIVETSFLAHKDGVRGQGVEPLLGYQVNQLQMLVALKLGQVRLVKLVLNLLVLEVLLFPRIVYVSNKSQKNQKFLQMPGISSNEALPRQFRK